MHHYLSIFNKTINRKKNNREKIIRQKLKYNRNGHKKNIKIKKNNTTTRHSLF
jgi:hypothetical protein